MIWTTDWLRHIPQWGPLSLMMWDWKRADQELRRAIELNPNLSEPRVYLSSYVAAVGKVHAEVDEDRLGAKS